MNPLALFAKVEADYAAALARRSDYAKREKTIRLHSCPDCHGALTVGREVQAPESSFRWREMPCTDCRRMFFISDKWAF